MRFLVDSCVSVSACAFLRQEGHDVIWVPEEFVGDPGDEAIIDKAVDAGCIDYRYPGYVESPPQEQVIKERESCAGSARCGIPVPESGLFAVGTNHRRV